MRIHDQITAARRDMTSLLEAAREDGTLPDEAASVVERLVLLASGWMDVAGKLSDLYDQAHFHAIYPPEGFRYVEGRTYPRRDGMLVTIEASDDSHRGYETVRGDDASRHGGKVHRYNRSGAFEMGRTTGTDPREPCPRNLVPIEINMPGSSADEAVTLAPKVPENVRIESTPKPKSRRPRKAGS